MGSVPQSPSAGGGRRKPRRRRWFLWGFGAVVVAVLALPMVVDLRKPLMDLVVQQRVARIIEQTAGRGEVLATIEGRRFLIPGGYFLYPQDDSNEMLLWFLWPTMEPYSDEKYYEFWRAVGDEDRTFILYAQGASIGHFDGFFQKTTEGLERSERPNKLGLYVWRGATGDKDIFSPAAGHTDATLQCIKIGEVPYPGCNCRVWYKEDIFLSIGFPRRLLPKWRDILARTRGLLTRFEAAAAERQRAGGERALRDTDVSGAR